MPCQAPFVFVRVMGRAVTWNSCLKTRIYDHLHIFPTVHDHHTQLHLGHDLAMSSCHHSAQFLFWVMVHKLTCPTLRNIYIFKETYKTGKTSECLLICYIKIFVFQNASLGGSLKE